MGAQVGAAHPKLLQEHEADSGLQRHAGTHVVGHGAANRRLGERGRHCHDAVVDPERVQVAFARQLQLQDRND
eukprot:650561-Rhodomonas_salina.4